MPFIIDPFTTGTHQITIPPGGLPDTYPLPPNPPGPRETFFSNGAPNTLSNPWNQPVTLDIAPKGIGILGKGILIVNSGFGALAALQVRYGTFRQHGAAQLGLNFSTNSAFRLTFVGLATSETLGINVQVMLHGSIQVYDNGTDTPPPSPNQFSRDFAFSGFNPKFDPSVAIDGLQILLSGGGTLTYGLILFEAIP
jgi:hypothetical protein